MDNTSQDIITTPTSWWENTYPSRYYAFETTNTLNSYPIAGLADMNVYDSQPTWITSDMVTIPLTEDQWVNINPCNLIIQDGKLVNYVPPTTSTTTSTTTTGESNA